MRRDRGSVKLQTTVTSLQQYNIACVCVCVWTYMCAPSFPSGAEHTTTIMGGAAWRSSNNEMMCVCVFVCRGRNREMCI